MKKKISTITSIFLALSLVAQPVVAAGIEESEEIAVLSIDETEENTDSIDETEENTASIDETEENTASIDETEELVITESGEESPAMLTSVDSGTCGANMTWELQGDTDVGYTLVINGSGDMTNYKNPSTSTSLAPWYQYNLDIVELQIADTVTSIGNYAFYDIPYIDTVKLPSGLTKIGAYAFSLCDNLTDLVFPDSLEKVGGFAFSYCNNLTSIKIPDSVTDLAYGAFHNCVSLEEVVLPASITQIESQSFSNDPALKSVIIPDGVDYIEDYAFECSGLETIVMPVSVTEIAYYAFDQCPITEVLYKGTQEQWNAIEIADEGNESLTAANITYAYDPDPSCVILEQPEDVTAGVKSPVTFSVTAKNAVSYQWQYSKDGKKWYDSSAASAKTNSLTITVSSANAGNTYRCLITGKDASVLYSNEVCINLIPGVVILSQPHSVTGILGETISFTLEAENAVSYQWYYSKDGTSWYKSGVTGNNTASISVKITATNQNYKYRCRMVGQDGNGKNSNAVGIVVVKEQPQVSQAIIGTTASFTVKADNIASYQWQYSKNNGESWFNSSAAGYNTSTISMKATVTNHNTIYRCKLTNTNGITAYSASAGFEKQLMIISQPISSEGMIGETVKLSVEAINVASYQWYYSKDGKSWYKSGATGASTNTLAIQLSSTNVGRYYRCKLTDADGKSLYTDTVIVQKK